MIKTFSLLSVICFISLSAADVDQRPIRRTSSEQAEFDRRTFVQCRLDSNEGTYSTLQELLVIFGQQWKQMSKKQKSTTKANDLKKYNLK